jgi:prepilin-type N-terminal cleavage/methylation domain-containing protein
MHERIRHVPPRERGLSLVEMLVAVAVVGLLATIFVPALVVSVRSAREARAVSNLRAIAAAEMAIYAREKRFAVFEELFATGAIPAQFEREVGGGPRGSGSEAVSDGAYAYSLRFTRYARGITVDADPREGYLGTHRWFRFRIGRTAQSAAGGEVVVYVAEPSPRPPPARAYRPLGGER